MVFFSVELFICLFVYLLSRFFASTSQQLNARKGFTFHFYLFTTLYTIHRTAITSAMRPAQI